MALLTVMGLYNFDNTLFDNLLTPTGVDRSKLVNKIILETAELEVVYPTPRFFKIAIGLWSATQNITWERIYTASQLEYNPIENYDRQETESNTNTRAHSGTDTTSGTGSSATTESDINKIAGFDSSTLVEHDSALNSSSTQATNSQSFVHGEQIADTGSRTSRIHGNIGVTTSQQMLEEDLQVAGKLNIYDVITNEFKNRFCILVY